MKLVAHRSSLVLLAVLLILSGILGCGKGETPEERLERLRLNHELRPLGFTTILAKASPAVDAALVDDPEAEPVDAPEPVGLIDLTLANQGAEALPLLTVLVTITDEAGATKLRERKTLDLSGLRPGVATQMPVRLPGVEIAETDNVQVELEANLPPEELRLLPEFASLQTQ